MNPKEKCPKCGKMRVLKWHLKDCKGDGGAGVPAFVGSKPPNDPMEDGISMNPNEANAIAEIAGKAASEAAANVANDMWKRIPELVDKILVARLDQMGSGQNQPATAQQAQPAAGSGILGILNTISPMIKMMQPEQQQTDIGRLADTLSGLQKLTDVLNAPYNRGMQDMSTLLSMSLRAGANPQDVATAAKTFVDERTRKPNEQSTQHS